MNGRDERLPRQQRRLTAGANLPKLASARTEGGQGDDHRPGSRDRGRRRLSFPVGRRDRDRRTWASGRNRWERGGVRADRRRRAGRAALVAITIWAVAAATLTVPRSGVPSRDSTRADHRAVRSHDPSRGRVTGPRPAPGGGATSSPLDSWVTDVLEYDLRGPEPPAVRVSDVPSDPFEATEGTPTAGEQEEGEDVGGRDRWFYGQRAFPGGTIPPRAYLRAYAQAARIPVAGTGSRAVGAAPPPWTSIGPHPVQGVDFEATGKSPVSGRVATIAVDPTNAQVAYIGGAVGGVWKTTDGGSHWTPLFDDQASLAIGAIAIDPNAVSTVYAGTGEANGNPDSYYGTGIYRSTNGGTTWAKIGGATFDNCHIGEIAVKPGASATLLVAVDTDGNPGATACNGGGWGGRPFGGDREGGTTPGNPPRAPRPPNPPLGVGAR